MRENDFYWYNFCLYVHYSSNSGINEKKEETQMTVGEWIMFWLAFFTTMIVYN